ncbi:MAG: DUF2200 domain-containing protein [Pseudomonadota bacterium]
MNERVFAMDFAGIHRMYVNKVEKKGRTRSELDEALTWVTGYSQKQLDAQLEAHKDCRSFVEEAPLNPDRTLIKGVVCGVRVEEVEDPIMRELRYMDKVVDELAKGKTMEKILRKPS